MTHGCCAHDFGSGFLVVGVDTVSPRRAVAVHSSDGRAWAAPLSLPVRPETDFSIANSVASDGAVLVAVGEDTIFGRSPNTDVSDASIWMSTDGESWVHVPPESLRGSAILQSRSPVGSAVRFGDVWIALGTTGGDEAASPGVVWMGST
jgi:hypothetical protein